jgi:hypothetical protein
MAGAPSLDHEGELDPWVVVVFQEAVYLVGEVREQAVVVVEVRE